MGRFSRLIGKEVLSPKPEVAVEAPKPYTPAPKYSTEPKKVESLSSRLKKNGF